MTAAYPNLVKVRFVITRDLNIKTMMEEEEVLIDTYRTKRGSRRRKGTIPSIRDGVHRSGMPLYLHLKRI